MTINLPNWYERLIGQLTGSDLTRSGTLDRIGDGVRRLSMLFNRLEARGPGMTDRYMRDPGLLEAYSTYYMTANMFKLAAPLDELGVSPLFAGSANGLSVLDIGSGTGTTLLGLLAWIESRAVPVGPVAFHASDAVPEALAYVRRLCSLLPGVLTRRGLTLSTGVLDLTRPPSADRTFDLVVLANVISELPALDVDVLSDLLLARLSERGAAIFIEPALRETSRALLQLRDAMVRRGWTIIAPCTRQGSCPALLDERDWCHHELPWVRPEFIRAIDERVGNVKLSLKFSYLVLNRQGATPADGAGTPVDRFRVVSERFDEKGRTRAYLCGQCGRLPFLLNDRDACEANRVFREIARYDMLAVDGFETRKHDARILRTTRVERLKSRSLSLRIESTGGSGTNAPRAEDT